MILISVSQVEAAPFNNEEQVPTALEVINDLVSEDEPTEPSHPEKEVKEEPVLTWRDNPRGCNTDTQYIRADNFECIDKPKPQIVAVTASHPVGCENYRNLVSQYSWNNEVALRVMRAESGCNPSAVGDNYVIGGVYAPSCGLFQVRTLPGRPSCSALKNPSTNIANAYKLYQASGWQPWSVCKNGKVSCW